MQRDVVAVDSQLKRSITARRGTITGAPTDTYGQVQVDSVALVMDVIKRQNEAILNIASRINRVHDEANRLNAHTFIPIPY